MIRMPFRVSPADYPCPSTADTRTIGNRVDPSPDIGLEGAAAGEQGFAAAQSGNSYAGGAVRWLLRSWT
jgi:hypothetical protein